MGVYVPQVEGVNFGVVCPHWPNGFNVVLIVCGLWRHLACQVFVMTKFA